MPQPFVWITLIPTAVLFIFWMRDKRRLTRKLQELSAQQLETCRVLNELIDESGKITLEFARLLPKAGSPAFAGGFNDSRSGEPKRKGVEKRHMVLHMAQKGHTPREIADHLQVPTGEVDLILTLNQSRHTKVSA
jgi:hypothetical protein